MASKKLQLKYGENHLFTQNVDEKENIPEHVPEPKTEPIISDMNHSNNTTKPENLEAKQNQERNKRGANYILEQKLLKRFKMMDKESNKHPIRILPLLSSLEDKEMSSLAYGLPKEISFATKQILTNDINRGKKGMSDQIRKVIDDNSEFHNEEEMVVLGPNSTALKKTCVEGIDWQKSSSAVARVLLKHIFGLDVLATHNLSGKKSPAFIEIPNMPEKGQLDPLVIADVINFMYLTLQMSEKEVKMAVTSACADAAKKGKRKSILEVKREY